MKHIRIMDQPKSMASILYACFCFSVYSQHDKPGIFFKFSAHVFLYHRRCPCYNNIHSYCTKEGISMTTYYALRCQEYQGIFLEQRAFEKMKKTYPHAQEQRFPNAKQALEWIHERPAFLPAAIKKNASEKQTLRYAALSSSQKETIEGTCRLFHQGKRVITIYGAAGTGKTTIVRFIMKKLNIQKKQLLFTTFTGRASLMLRKKGIDAKTIHSTFYTCFKNKQGKFRFKLKEELNGQPKLIVIDEISMVGKRLFDDILSFDVPILCLGDPYQLQPVMDDRVELTPDFLLTDIFRQHKDSHIISFATQIRTSGSWKGSWHESDLLCMPARRAHVQDYLDADQVLCGTNSMRKRINAGMRKHLGFTQLLPQQGDKLISLDNHWDVLDEELEEFALVNGMIVTVDEIYAIHLDKHVFYNQYMDVRLKADGFENIYFQTRINLCPFLEIDTELEEEAEGLREFLSCAHHFDYGYAITIHKAQGSEWDHVLVYGNFWGKEKRQMAYTAATRAMKKLVWLQTE